MRNHVLLDAGTKRDKRRNGDDFGSEFFRSGPELHRICVDGGGGSQGAPLSELRLQRLIDRGLEHHAHVLIVVVASSVVVAGGVGEDGEALLIYADALHLCRPLRGVCGQRIELDAFVRRRRCVTVCRRLLGGDSVIEGCRLGRGLEFVVTRLRQQRCPLVFEPAWRV